MFERSEENARKVEALVALLSTRKRGDVVTHEEIAGVIGLSPSDDRKSRYYGVCRRARSIHQEDLGITSVPETNVGFRLLTAAETLTDHQRDRFRRARRQFRRASRAAVSLPDADLTREQREFRDAAASAAYAAESFAKERVARAAAAAKPIGGLPYPRIDLSRPVA